MIVFLLCSVVLLLHILVSYRTADDDDCNLEFWDLGHFNQFLDWQHPNPGMLRLQKICQNIISRVLDDDNNNFGHFMTIIYAP